MSLLIPESATVVIEYDGVRYKFRNMATANAFMKCVTGSQSGIATCLKKFAPLESNKLNVPQKSATKTVSKIFVCECDGYKYTFKNMIDALNFLSCMEQSNNDGAYCHMTFPADSLVLLNSQDKTLSNR